MELAWQQEGGGKGEEEQRRPWPLPDGCIERLGCLRVGQQPVVQPAEAIKQTKQRHRTNGGDRHQLDQTLEGDRQHQPVVLLTTGDMFGSEEDGEEDDQQTIAQCHQL